MRYDVEWKAEGVVTVDAASERDAIEAAQEMDPVDSVNERAETLTLTARSSFL